MKIERTYSIFEVFSASLLLDFPSLFGCLAVDVAAAAGRASAGVAGDARVEGGREGVVDVRRLVRGGRGVLR